MPARRRRIMGGRRIHRRRVGGSKFTDFFTKTIPGAAKVVYNKALKPVGKFIKDQHLISKGLKLIPHPGAQLGSTVAGAVGLGRRRRRRRTAVGMGRRRRPMIGGLSSLNGRLFLV